jgi:hypothetical protein
MERINEEKMLGPHINSTCGAAVGITHGFHYIDQKIPTTGEDHTLGDDRR